MILGTTNDQNKFVLTHSIGSTYDFILSLFARQCLCAVVVHCDALSTSDWCGPPI